MDTQKKWEILAGAPKISSPTFTKDLVTIILNNRGIGTEKMESFLHPDLDEVTPEHVGINSDALEKTINRLGRARDTKEQIVVFGDYDVDGITGSAILWETFHELGFRAMPYIPHRIEEGYGLSIKGIEHILLKYPDVKLIVTVDNGIVATQAVKFANEKGIEVIITDHHTVGNTIPDAYAIVHTTKLCGAAVAWVLMNALYASLNEKEEEGQKRNRHLDLVCLATIADLVPLTDANRTLVTYGLNALRATQRPGLLALFSEAGITQANISVYDIGHIISPRLNAMGRLESAMDSLRLLCTKDRLRAMALAEKLGMTNRQRQIMTVRMSEHAKELVLSRPQLKKILIISHETYEQGVIGLIAGRLVETFYRPVIVFSKGEKVSKASARSVNGFNIIEFIRTHSHLLLDHGGHPMAAGFSIETEKLITFQESLETLAEEQITENVLTRIVKIDCLLPIDCVDKKLYDELLQLSPFGMGNPEPVFASEKVLIRDMKVLGAASRHLKLRVGNGVIIDAIGFNMGEWGNKIAIGDTIDMAYTIDENTWNGRTTLQLKIKDFKKA